MNDERDLKLGNIKDLDVDAEVQAGAEPRRQAQQSGSSNRAAADKAEPRKPGTTKTAAKKPARTDGNSVWMAATAFLLVLVIVLGAWFFRQLSTLQAVVDNRLSESTEQLGSLASQLSATDETVTQSTDQVKETLITHDSEIRKLWDVSNKRNRDWIKKSQADIAELTKQRTELSKAVESFKKELAAIKASNEQLQRVKNQLQTQVGVQAESLKQLESKAAAQQKQLEAVNKLLPAMQSLARMEGSGGGLSNRLTEIEAAIDAIDAHRRQVNVRLDRLDGGTP
jgi:septal ring factor EnvC (AmiA/AmiB activator)